MGRNLLGSGPTKNKRGPCCRVSGESFAAGKAAYPGRFRARRGVFARDFGFPTGPWGKGLCPPERMRRSGGGLLAHIVCVKYAFNVYFMCRNRFFLSANKALKMFRKRVTEALVFFCVFRVLFLFR